jgi:RHS repeat-associated protein
VIYGIPADLTNPEQFAPTPWEAYTYDANDLAPLCVGPDGPSLASAAPVSHHFTPSSIVIDALGRTIEAIARNGTNPSDWFRTRSTYDIRGNVLAVTDALNRVAFRYTYDLANRPWRIESIDAGLRRMVLNVLSSETERRDSKGGLTLQAYDLLQRPIRFWARDDAGSPISLRQRMAYGDAGNPAQAAPERAALRTRNLLGQLHRHHDEAGLTTVTALDFKGNPLDTSRRVIADAPILAVFTQAAANGFQVVPFQVDWQPRPQQTLAARESELLETTAYQTTASYDALNRVKRMQLPRDVEGKRRELRPIYNNAGGLEQVRLDDTLYVERIAYDAKGQRALIAYGNGVMTCYAYDEHTFRLKRLRSEHYTKPNDLHYHPGGAALQDYGYDYDLVGNILAIHDRAPGSGIRNNPEALSAGNPVLAQLLVSGDALNRRFEYDPIYRLLSASGRECDRPPEGEPFDNQPRCTDLTRSRAYTERYAYDPMGNMLRLEHRNGTGGFTRAFTVETANNRLREMKIGDSPFAYTFDANGNRRSETTARHFEWNHADQLKAFRTQTAGAEPSVYAHYLYDATGQRVKKLVRKQGGQVEVTHYINGVFEHHRWGSGAQAGENNHVHVIDDTQRIALVRFGAAHPDDRGPAMQFHLGDHLGSSNVVIDAAGALMNREEFTPYGETSFGSFVKKRYRFTGMERDEESGLSYHSARYYVPWVGRWISADPIGSKGGTNLFCYCNCNPIIHVDYHGEDFSIAADPEARTIRIEVNIVAISELGIDKLKEAATMWNQKTYSLKEGVFAGYKVSFDVNVEVDKGPEREKYREEMEWIGSITEDKIRTHQAKYLTNSYALKLVERIEGNYPPNNNSIPMFNNIYFSIFYPAPDLTDRDRAFAITAGSRYIYLPPPQGNTLNVSEDNYASTLAHEIGHVLGLGDPRKNNKGEHIYRDKATHDYDPYGITSYLPGKHGISDKNVEQISNKILLGLEISFMKDPKVRQQRLEQFSIPNFEFRAPAGGSSMESRTVMRN